jgi:hypothetical protein
MAVATSKYRYRVDAADLVVWVDSLWLAFARENGAAELTEQAVLGRPLWDFVEGEETRKLYREIHARVRSRVKSVVLPFRCDSPSLLRHMRMTITREDAGRLMYESLLIRVEPRRRLGMLDSQQPLSNSFVTMCSFCKRGLLESAGWLEVEDLCVRLQLFEAAKAPRLRHTVCPDCCHAVRHTLDNGNAA